MNGAGGFRGARADAAGDGRFSSLGHLLRVSWAFARRDWAISLTYRFSVIGRLLSALFAVAMLAGMSRLISPAVGVAGAGGAVGAGGGALAGGSPYLAAWGGEYLPFVLPGLVLADLVSAALRLFAEKLHDGQAYGLLEAELNTPTPALWVVLCAPLYQLFSVVVRAVIYLAGGALVFGVRYPAALWGWAVLAALLTVLAYVALGIAAAAFTLSLKRGDPVSLVLSGLTFLTGGIFFPVTVLPLWVQPLARLVPVSDGLEIVRAALLGSGVTVFWPRLAVLAGWALIGFPVAVVLFRSALRGARRDGSLGQY